MLLATLHQIDPFAIRWGHGGAIDGIRWYGLSYLFGFLLGYLLVRRVVARGISTVRGEQVADLIIFVALGVVIGGRLGYCIFYDSELLVRFSGSFPFWGVLMLNQGGMASHGGMIGGIIASWIYARRWGHRFSHVLDLIAFATPLGLMLGRIANFINGELYGRAAPDGFAFAWKFPREMLTWPADPQRQEDLTQLQPLLDTLAPPQTGIYNQLYTAMDRIRENDAHVIAVIEPLLTPRYPSQLLAALTEGVITMIVLLIVWRKARPPMMIAGAFSICYALMRIFNEFFREPDFGVRGVEALGLAISRGQLLSVGLLALGVIMVLAAIRSKTEPMGGWMGPKPENAVAGSASPEKSGAKTPKPVGDDPPPSSKKRGGRKR